MIVYADMRERLLPGAMRERLDGLIQLATSADDVRCRQDILLELLIEAGRLEQAVDDAASPTCDRWATENTPVRRLTDMVACALTERSTRTPAQLLALGSYLSETLDAVQWSDLPTPLDMVAPEGYMVYGLTPLAYAATVTARLRDLRAQAAPPHLVIIGVRSIGTSLSAIILSTARQQGWTADRVTVRPRGNPLARHIALDECARHRLRSQAQQGALFLIVDEGPGLSGSSLAAVAVALSDECGAPAEQVILMSAHGYPQPGIDPACWEIWMRHQVWALDPGTRLSDPQHVAAMVTREIGYAPDLVTIADATASDMPAFHPLLSAPRYRVSAGPEQYQAWFVGVGYIGRQKAHRAATLARADFLDPLVCALATNTPRGWPSEYLQGFVIQQATSPHVRQRSCAREMGVLVERLAAYYAAIATHSAGFVTEQPDWRDLVTLIETNTRAWFGSTRDDLLTLLAAWCGVMSRAPRTAIDGQPQSFWWTRQDSHITKMGFAAGWMDHRAGRLPDLALDISGACAEWSLPEWATTALGAAVIRHTGDYTLLQRLPFARVLYAATELGYFDHAYHCWGEVETYRHQRQLCDIARRRMATLLDTALRALPQVLPTWTSSVVDQSHRRDAALCVS